MNIRSAELLQNAIQNAANQFNTKRQLELEAQRNAIEDSYRQAQMMHYAGMEKHYANMEEKQADAAALQNKRMDEIENKYGVQQSMQALSDAQANMTQGLQELSLDQKLTPSQKTQYFRESIDSQPQFKTQFLQNPMWNALYAGQGDWNAVAGTVREYQAANGGSGARPRPPADNSEYDKDVSAAPQRIANAVAQSDANVPKGPDGRVSVAVTTDPAVDQRLGMLAGSLRAAGVPGALAAAEGLTYGTNAVLRPNITPGPSGWGGKDPSTNSFTLTPGGINQDAINAVANAPGGTNILSQYGFQLPQSAPTVGNTAVNANGIPTGRVRVQNQSGQFGYVPQEQLPSALSQGYKLAPLTQGQ